MPKLYTGAPLAWVCWVPWNPSILREGFENPSILKKESKEVSKEEICKRELSEGRSKRNKAFVEKCKVEEDLFYEYQIALKAKESKKLTEVEVEKIYQIYLRFKEGRMAES